MKRKFMARKGQKDKPGSKIRGKFGAKKKLTKTRINTKIGVDTKISDKNQEKAERIIEIVGVKFEIGHLFEDNIFKAPETGIKDGKVQIKTVRKFKIPIPKSFFNSIKMNEIKKGFQIINI